MLTAAVTSHMYAHTHTRAHTHMLHILMYALYYIQYQQTVQCHLYRMQECATRLNYNLISQTHITTIGVRTGAARGASFFRGGASQASRDPSAHGRGQVKSNTLTCTPRNNSCVPNQIAGNV